MKNNCTNCETANDIVSKYCSICGYKLPIIEKEAASETKIEGSKTTKSKFNWKQLVGFFIGFTIIFSVTFYIFYKTIDEKLIEISDSLNKNCPTQIDQYTILKNTVALPNKTFQYNYKLIDLSKDQVNLDTVKKYVFSGILQNVKTSPDMEEMRKENIIFNYNYEDKDGVFVTKYVVTPEMYN